MLNARDMIDINKDVADIISDWDIPIQLWVPLPQESQPNWDPIMREMVGPVSYNKILDIPAERRDISESTLVSSAGGDKYEGNVTIHIPLVHNGDEIPLDEEMLVILDNNIDDPWFIHSIIPRPGETRLSIHRRVGGG